MTPQSKPNILAVLDLTRHTIPLPAENVEGRAGGCDPTAPVGTALKFRAQSDRAISILPGACHRTITIFLLSARSPDFSS